MVWRTAGKQRNESSLLFGSASVLGRSCIPEPQRLNDHVEGKKMFIDLAERHFSLFSQKRGIFLLPFFAFDKYSCVT
jgi:hypothetical protein